MRAPERAETTLPTITADDLDGMAQNDILYLSFRPLQSKYLLTDGYGFLVKITKNAGSDVNFHYIGRAAGGAYPYIIDADGHATGDDLYFGTDMINAFNAQLTALFTSFGYTSHLGSDDHVSHDATIKYVKHGVSPSISDVQENNVLALNHDFGGGLINPVIRVADLDGTRREYYVLVDAESHILVSDEYLNISASEVLFDEDLNTSIILWMDAIYGSDAWSNQSDEVQEFEEANKFILVQ